MKTPCEIVVAKLLPNIRALVTIELDSKYAAAFYNRSIAYAQLDDFDKSDADYEKAIELNSDLQD
jgi:tetratricopeptide (TPR) repeat protein